MYHATNLIDISNFFILICTPYDQDQKLKETCSKFSSDPVSFQQQIVDIETTDKIFDNFIVSKTLCTEPWSHLEINNQGQIRPCCVSSQILGNINKNSIKEIFSGDEMIQLRHQLISGQKPNGCATCWKLEEMGLTSNRIKHLLLNKKQLLSKWIQDPDIRSLDLKPGITCNFKCRICGPDSSSLHLQETNKQKKIKIAPLPDWIDLQIHQITESLDKIENIDMYGGEPFLIKKLTDLIKSISSTDRAKNVRLHYNSNGSIYPESLIEHWKQFRHIDLNFSIDNIGKRFELERGGSWVEINSNIQKLLELKLSNLKITIMSTVSIDRKSVV
jgi:radical SAM protein with 4Fe4S-binding SPASM domain